MFCGLVVTGYKLNLAVHFPGSPALKQLDSGWAVRINWSSVCSVLEMLTLDASSMTYPSADICSAGTESIQQFLCKGKQEKSVGAGENLGDCAVL